MGTKDFNQLDLLIGRWRLRQVQRHFQAGDTVLDFGCGHQALLLRTIAGRIRRGVGLDYDVADARLAPHVEILGRRFVDRLDFPDATFDRIALLAVIEHIPPADVPVLLAEFRRVLKPGGQLVLTTPTPAARPVLEFLAFRLRVISAPEIRDHKHYYSRADLLALADRHQFTCSRYATFQLGLNSVAVFDRAAAPGGPRADN